MLLTHHFDVHANSRLIGNSIAAVALAGKGLWLKQPVKKECLKYFLFLVRLYSQPLSVHLRDPDSFKVYRFARGDKMGGAGHNAA